jgi:hypothetical protein
MIQLDELGTLYGPATANAQGEVTAQPAALPGWHVNATAAVLGWDAYKVTPSTPRRVFGGATTVHYTFTNQAAFQTAKAAVDFNAPDAPRVPGSITMRQAQLALMGAGLLNTVNAAVAAMPGAQGDAARIEWNASSTVERNKPLVLAMASVLGLTAAQIDALFIAGEKL